MKSRLTYLPVLCLIIAVTAYSDDGGTTSPFAFGAGAREISLGGSTLSSADPTTAPYWNPSRLADAEWLSLAGFHTRLYESDVVYQYFGFTFPTLDLGNFGFGVFRLGIDDIERRDQNNLLTGFFDDSRLSYYLAYGRKISRFDVGFSMNLENHKLDSYSATSSPGFNLSIGRTIPVNNKYIRQLTMTLVGRNLVRPSMELYESKIKYPYEADFGFSVKIFPVGNNRHELNLSGALAKTDFLITKLSLGLEYDFQKLLFLRGGFADKRFSIGGGLKFKYLAFDYAFVERDLGSLHLFNITTTIGRSISEKQAIRDSKREAQFDSNMNNRLSSRYREMISELMKQGHDFLSADSLESAGACFDRALFLAQTNAGDTTEIARLAAEVHARIKEADDLSAYGSYIDSARTRYESKDYLGARYFANLAKTKIPDGAEADDFLNLADDAISNMVSHDEMIEEKLFAIDSLLGYGFAEKALNLAKSLDQFADGNDRIRLICKKAEFEYWKEKALQAYNSQDHSAAIKAIDTALVLFPGHKWCLDLRQDINRDKTAQSKATSVEPNRSAVAVSAELLHETENDYITAQKLFEGGDLRRAIELWEKVEKSVPDYQSVREYLVRAYRFVGIELYGQNRLEESIVYWKKAIELDSTNRELQEYIKRTESEIRKLKELSYESK